MSSLPRVALGSCQGDSDSTYLLWALVEFLNQHGQQVQVFEDQARFGLDEACRAVCGERPRYLDSWIMSPELCRESFSHGAGGCNFAVVHGRYAAPRRPPASMDGGQLDALGEWLDLPRLAVVDVSRLHDCQLPPRPAAADALLLDRFAEGTFPHWQTMFESLWGLPVLGGLPELPLLRKQMQSCLDHGANPCGYCRHLGDHLAKTLRYERLRKLADRQFVATLPNVFRPGDKLAGLKIAVAYDEALHCYFPDVLDLLELQGATILDFSPLRDEALPADVDVIYLGGGHPEKIAAELAGNSCMTLALRERARQGRRIYAEAGGMAYLSQHLVLPGGEAFPMAGILPAVASFDPHAGPPRPAELMLARDHWLGVAGARLRGYFNPSWQFEATAAIVPMVAEIEPSLRLIARGQALGSRLNINFAAQPEFLRRFSAVGAHSVA